MIPALLNPVRLSRIGSFSIVSTVWALAPLYDSPDIPTLCARLARDEVFPAPLDGGAEFIHGALVDAILAIADSLHPVFRRSGLPGLCGVVDLDGVPIWFSIHGDLADNWYSAEPDWWADASAGRLGDLVDVRYDLEALSLD